MARGRGKQRGGGRGRGRGGNKNSFSKFDSKSFNKRDSSHLKKFGDVDRSYGSSDKRRKVEATQPQKQYSSDEENAEEQPQDHMKLLLSTFSGFNKNAHKNAIDSESDEESDLEEETTVVSGNSAGPVSEGADTGSDLESVSSDDENEENIGSDSEDFDDLSSKPKGSKTSSSQLRAATDSSQESDAEIEEEEAGEVVEEEDEDEAQKNSDEDQDHLDPFGRHIYYDMNDSLYELVSKVPPPTEKHLLTWPVLGQLVVELPKLEDASAPKKVPTKPSVSLEGDKKFTEAGTVPTRIHEIDWSKLFIKSQIQNNLLEANKLNVGEENTSLLTPLQRELFSLINNYQDVYYPERTLDKGEEVRFVYCLHAVNHVLKTRTKILHHNAKVLRSHDVPEECRDQGLMRPKVVILVPFKESAFRVVKMIIAILFKDEKACVEHMKRFVEEHTGDEIAMPRKNPRPEDYEATFAGNTDDTFRIGMTVTRKSLKLYADFYSADIIVASPLGLRLIIGAEGEAQRDFDFLAAIELLVMDQTELFFMQNWDHVLHVVDHFHLQPKDSHGTDFARVRSWALNGWARYYRQTLLFSALQLPEINALFNRKCHNYAGKVRIVNPVITGSICQVVVQLPQVFHRFVANSPIEAIDARFDMFIKKILPQYKDSIMNRVMIYIPSYFDYVRVRNYFKREDTSFTQICEYSKDGKIARARDMFFHGDVHFLLYSERVHFFRRLRIKGIRHIVFYQPPTMPHFYGELCNLMDQAFQDKRGGPGDNSSVTVLYCKYDVQQLTALVGTDRTKRMVSSARNVHMFMTGQ